MNKLKIIIPLLPYILIFLLLAVAGGNCLRYLFRPITELPTYCAVLK